GRAPRRARALRPRAAPGAGAVARRPAAAARLTRGMPMAEPLIVTVAPNGAYKQRGDHPALPLTARELADTARRCLAAGAAMMHLHVRDAQGRHSLDVETYREALAAVRGAVGDEMVLQVTS